MKQLNLLDPNSENFCCGAICPRKDVQDRIDKMQHTINCAHEYFTCDHFPDDKFEEMLKQLEELSIKPP